MRAPRAPRRSVATVERVRGSLTLPAAFQLVATMRPCPCGWFGDVEHACRCTPALIRRYQRRVPEALRERIEIHLQASRAVSCRHRRRINVRGHEEGVPHDQGYRACRVTVPAASWHRRSANDSVPIRIRDSVRSAAHG
jgi:hypothetical protein